MCLLLGIILIILMVLLIAVVLLAVVVWLGLWLARKVVKGLIDLFDKTTKNGDGKPKFN